MAGNGQLLVPVKGHAHRGFRSARQFDRGDGVDGIVDGDDPDQPVVVVHPVTGARSLYANSTWSISIEAMDKAESQALIEKLFAHSYAPERQYDHVWQWNDVLLWNNLAVQHARREQSDYAGGPRALQRVALCEETLQQSIERARAKQAA